MKYKEYYLHLETGSMSLFHTQEDITKFVKLFNLEILNKELIPYDGYVVTKMDPKTYDLLSVLAEEYVKYYKTSGFTFAEFCENLGYGK